MSDFMPDSNNHELATVRATDLATSVAPMKLASTISSDSPANKARVFNATSGAVSLSATAEKDGLVLDVVDIFQTVGVRKSRNVMLPDSPCVNTYLLTTDGTTYMSQSDGIARSAYDLVSPSMFPDCGKSLPDGCLHLAVQAKKLANDNTIKSLVIVG